MACERSAKTRGPLEAWVWRINGAAGSKGAPKAAERRGVYAAERACGHGLVSSFQPRDSKDLPPAHDALKRLVNFEG